MKLVALATLCLLGAVSAFGLQTNTNNALNTNIRSSTPFIGRNKAMVQPIGIDGQRLNNGATNNIVSFSIVTSIAPSLILYLYISTLQRNTGNCDSFHI